MNKTITTGAILSVFVLGIAFGIAKLRESQKSAPEIYHNSITEVPRDSNQLQVIENRNLLADTADLDGGVHGGNLTGRSKKFH
jgi:hypothetical protein